MPSVSLQLFMPFGQCALYVMGKQLLSPKQIVGLERTEGIWLDNVRAGTGKDGARVLWEGCHAWYLKIKIKTLHGPVNNYIETHIYL